MAFANHDSQFTESVRDGTRPIAPSTQPQETLTEVQHHRKPLERQSWEDESWYRYQSWQQHDQQYTMHHNTDWQVQHLADVPRHQNSAPAYLPPVIPGTLPLPGKPSESMYCPQPSDQDRDDKVARVLHQCGSNHPQGTKAGPTSQVPYHPQHSTQASANSLPQDLTSSPLLQHDERDDKHKSALVGNGSSLPDSCTDSVYDTRTLGNVDQIPRTQSRAMVACSNFRRQKKKCKEGNPCSACEEHGLTCDYDGLPFAISKKDIKKTNLMLVEISDTVRELKHRNSSESQRMGRQEDECDPGGPAMSTEFPRPRRLSFPPREDEDSMGPLHPIHSWPSLETLLREADVEFDHTYVMKAEQRPSLYLYHKDEEVERWGDARADRLTGFVNHDESVPSHVLSTNIQYRGYDPSGGRPEVHNARQQRYEVERRNPINSLPPDVATAEALYESYMQQMHTQQPFLDKGEVRGLLDGFIAWHEIPIQPSVTADHCDTASGRPTKRRRHDNRSDVPPLRQLRPAPLLHHALVYLIFALGEICMCRGPLPADSPPSERSGTPSSSLGQVLEAESSPLVFDNADAVSLASSQTPSVDRGQRGNDDLARRRVPGLVYYAKATEIFGGQIDGSSLVHAHIFLLAGLYKGQLARPKESMSWYAMAGRILRQLLRDQKLCDRTYWTWVSDNSQVLKEKSERLITNEYQNSIVLTSWAWVDLESDISAELNLSSSDTVSIEDGLPMPLVFPDVSGGCEDTSQPTEILLRFTSQVYLRKQLNHVHRQLHGLGCEELSLLEIQCILRNHEATISAWQRDLPASMSWDLDDSPPTDILHARWRARYWSLRYLINRPFLDYILQVKPHPRSGVDKAVPDFQGQTRHEAEFHLFRAISGMSEEEVQIGYQTCIEAAAQSTVAFDNVPGRPIVTNIHGTAHA
jgi:hypothetical protein